MFDNATAARAAQEKRVILAKVTEYRGFVVIDAVGEEVEHPCWVPCDVGRVGCMVHQTRQHLGISPEALALLQLIERSYHGIGSVSAYGDSFGWIGGHQRLVNPHKADIDRYFELPPHVVITNEAPEWARKYVDHKLASRLRNKCLRLDDGR
jgi:hypothetical protein